MTINDKIKQILLDKNLTPSYFADEIGVQRSSISHILSGRNRPSFDIIQKIIRRFPELGYEWIMEDDSQGTNGMAMGGYNSNRPTNSRTAINDRIDRSATIPNTQLPFTYSPPQAPTTRSLRTELPPMHPNPAPTESISGNLIDASFTSSPEKRVERILIFYTDGSFREYTPSA